MFIFLTPSCTFKVEWLDGSMTGPPFTTVAGWREVLSFACFSAGLDLSNWFLVCHQQEKCLFQRCSHTLGEPVLCGFAHKLWAWSFFPTYRCPMIPRLEHPSSSKVIWVWHSTCSHHQVAFGVECTALSVWPEASFTATAASSNFSHSSRKEMKGGRYNLILPQMADAKRDGPNKILFLLCSGKGSGEGLGGFGAEPGQVQQGSGEGSGEGLGGFGADPAEVFLALGLQHASERFVKIPRCGCWGYHRSLFWYPWTEKKQILPALPRMFCSQGIAARAEQGNAKGSDLTEVGGQSHFVGSRGALSRGLEIQNNQVLVPQQLFLSSNVVCFFLVVSSMLFLVLIDIAVVFFIFVISCCSPRRHDFCDCDRHFGYFLFKITVTGRSSSWN